MRLRHAAILVLVGAALAAPAFADQVTDQISKALAAYQNHQPRAALAALDAAANTLRQARADALKELLPPAPADWIADPAQTSAVSAAMLGGGITASRTYHLGDEQVEVQYTTDSPMLMQMATLVDSPLGESPGVKTIKIGGRDTSYTAKDNSFLTVAGKAIIRVQGNPQTPQSTVPNLPGCDRPVGAGEDGGLRSSRRPPRRDRG